MIFQRHTTQCRQRRVPPQTLPFHKRKSFFPNTILHCVSTSLLLDLTSQIFKRGLQVFLLHIGFAFRRAPSTNLGGRLRHTLLQRHRHFASGFRWIPPLKSATCSSALELPSTTRNVLRITVASGTIFGFTKVIETECGSFFTIIFSMCLSLMGGMSTFRNRIRAHLLFEAALFKSAIDSP